MELLRETDNRDIDMRSVIAILRRQVRVIAITAAVILGLALVFLMTVTQTYTATALVLIDPDSKSILSPQQSVATSAGQDNAVVDSQVEILRSDALAVSVIKQYGLVGDAVFGPRTSTIKRLARAVGIANADPSGQELALARTLSRFQKSTAFRRKGLTYLISVSMTSPSPQQASELANALAETYINRQIDSKVSDTLAARNALGQQIENSTLSLASYETALDELVARNAGFSSQSPPSPRVADLRSDLETAQSRLSITEQNEIRVRTFMQQEDWTGLATSLQDDILLKLGAERSALMEKMTAPEHSDPSQSLHQALAELDARFSAQTNNRLAGISQNVEILDQEIASLKAQLRREYLSSDLPPETLASIFALQQDSSIARSQYQNLLSRMRDLETEARIQFADARIVSPAMVPIAPSFPNRALVLLAALAASTGVGISLAFLKEYYIGGVTSTTQLADLLQVQATAAVPQIPDMSTARRSVADEITNAPLSVYSESIRKLKAAIDQSFRIQETGQNAENLTGGKTILITSALENEGKTTTALALARTYAQAGRKTLLIDADLRRPSLHRQLGFEPQAGFLEYLTGGLDPDQTATFYARDPASDLALIMGAEKSEFPTDQLLCSSRFETLLAHAAEVYEVILIDSSPLLPVVDARYIAHHADCVVMAVKWASTSQSDLRSAVVPLRQSMQKSAGFIPVLNQRRDVSNRGTNTGYYSRYSAAT